MGIRGFTSFVDSKNYHLLQELKLHDTKVVIDGNNFYHFLYYYLHVKHHYGGDYDIYYKKVREIFQMFADCNIQPYVVFDGGYEPDGRKMKTVLERALTRIKKAKYLSHGKRGKILPILADETFRTVLTDMGVPFVVCDFEADAPIAKVANDLECPVMSNDSDFFVFNLKGGFIPFDYVDFRLCTAEDSNTGKMFKFLPVERYHIDLFPRMFPQFSHKLLPVLAVLLGNDFIESSTFETFFASLKYCSSKTLPQKQRKLTSVIKWLEHYTSCEEAVKALVGYLPKDSVERLRVLIEKCIHFYTIHEETFSLMEVFVGDGQSALVQCTDSVKLIDGLHPPDWIYRAHRTGGIAPTQLNILALHKVVLLSQVENTRVESAYTTSQAIRQVIYGILAQDQTLAKKNDDQNVRVLEYTRDDHGNLKKSLMEPVCMLPHSGAVPALSEMLGRPHNKSLELLIEVLEVPKSTADRFSAELKLLACAIVYWVLHSNPKVTSHHYHAMLVCIILLHAKTRIRQVKKRSKSDCDGEGIEIDLEQDYFGPTANEHCCEESVQTENDPTAICVRSLCMIATEQQLTRFIQATDKHHGKFASITNTNPVECSVTHSTSQFQACLLDCMNLNKLLLNPLPNPQPHRFFSGVFLYNFTKELRSRSKPVMYIIEILGAKSPLADVFTQMEVALSGLVGEGCFQETAPGKKNAKKKQKKKRLSSVSSDSSDDSDALPDMVQAACEVDNRFNCLMLEDS